ncbi:nitric oxide reductase activation protein NorD [Ideonella sp. YS5]|uniref:nitric oxide reductase activation protein NorD n=1 Tax=Ideonella sp. YS5 TaxID=3453714 RepID=UPI003EEF916E
MEEWIGWQWHRAVTRLAAPPRHVEATVRLEQMQRSIGMLFRAGGGAPAVRLAPAGQRQTGGPRSWLERLSGSGQRAHLAGLQDEVFALPPELAVFDSATLNRELYLWLAALASRWISQGDWVADNLAATREALAAFPGLASRHARLVAAQLALRPDVTRLRGAAAEAEQAVQRALLGEAAPSMRLAPVDVAPVWLWLDSTGQCVAGAAAPRPDPDEPSAAAAPAASDLQRRRAERVTDDRHRAPLMMFFRAESILSWGEFTRVNRADDDSDDGQARAAADDVDTLAVADGGQRAASRVRFDLDLPSAAADDRPLGPGLRLPEWDWRARRLIADHCAVQTLVATPAEPYAPPPALRAIARRVRRRMELLRAAPRRLHGQRDGDQLDVDAWVRHRSDAAARTALDTPPVWCRHERIERSLATLLLADLSLSTDAYATQSARVIDLIRDALFVFGEALAASGDPFEMLGFSSVRRQHVRLQHLKGFDETWSGAARDRVGAIKPGYYTRMGAAIRHATHRLAARPERQRLLLILTDGKPNDLDVYEGRYGLEDTRHAVQAARAAGLTPFAVTIDEQAHDYLPMLFGRQGYAMVHRPQDLVQRLAGLYATLTRAD